MDADNIIMFIVWGAFIAIYIVTSIRKSRHNSENTGNHVVRQQVEKKSEVINLEEVFNFAFNTPAETDNSPVAPETSPSIPHTPRTLPEEGQRVTKPRPTRPMPSVHHHVSPSASKARNMLRDKDALRRTLILGQILEPKF